MEPHRQISVVKLISVTGLFMVGMIYSVVVFNTGNPMWFLSNAEISRPMRIVVIDNGQRTAYVNSDREFDSLAEAINNSVTSLNNSDLVPIGLSEQTLEDYATDGLLIEVQYARPIKFNTSFRSGEPTSLLIPIRGRHAGNGIFFRGHRGEWWYGGMRMSDPSPIYSVLVDLGFQTAVDAFNSNG